MGKYEDRFRVAVRSSGITKKGEKLAKAVWDELPRLFKIGGENHPFDVVDVINQMARSYAADEQIRQQQKKHR